MTGYALNNTLNIHFVPKLYFCAKNVIISIPVPCSSGGDLGRCMFWAQASADEAGLCLKANPWPRPRWWGWWTEWRSIQPSLGLSARWSLQPPPLPSQLECTKHFSSLHQFSTQDHGNTDTSSLDVWLPNSSAVTQPGCYLLQSAETCMASPTDSALKLSLEIKYSKALLMLQKNEQTFKASFIKIILEN